MPVVDKNIARLSGQHRLGAWARCISTLTRVTWSGGHICLTGAVIATSWALRSLVKVDDVLFMSILLVNSSFRRPMSQTATERYVVQDLPDRYIRIRVLQEYIANRRNEFGEDWHLEVLRWSPGLLNRVLTSMSGGTEHPRSSPSHTAAKASNG
ncbi:hypothetical protein EJ04DRAFT_310150 [Polyplosphaeria fusca]|uniref:Uncharacterized protein n=1 Tax=Polyplosphaeria fusca TaxID=682080 RepID=A0A9P4R9M6_9PLEO|nr:hypothetical protein EJ04DRAFT_310150 [Polyplosphaeria fusca]